LQRGGIEIVVAGRPEVGLERAGDELARGEEFQVRGDAVLGRQRGLQPAAHGDLRNQHQVRRQRRLTRHRPPQLIGQQRRQQPQHVGRIQAEVGRGGGRHHAILPQPCRECRDIGDAAAGLRRS